METDFIYLMIVVIVGFDMMAVHLFNKQRKALDLSKPGNIERSKKLKLLIQIVCLQAFILPLILLFVVKPMLVSA